MGLAADLLRWRFLRHFFTKALATGGLIAAGIQFFGFLFPESKFFLGLTPLLATVGVSIAAGLAMSWPRPITQEYTTPNTRISIVRGNLLKQDGHLVVGTCDTFDTEPPVIIAKTSLQGQALESLFGGDVKELDRLLDEALQGKSINGAIKKPGKQKKFDIGTVAVVKQAGRRLFFLAYSTMNEKNEARATTDDVWKSLNSLWNEISIHGNGATVNVPVIGGGQARISNVLPAHDAVRLTILSFMFASRREKICSELRIVVQDAEYKKLDRLELQAFLASLRPS